MRFRRGARLDTSQVSDRRGMGGMVVGGGGVIGVVYLLITLFAGGGDLGALDLAAPENDLSAECQTGDDANQSQDCRIVGVVNSVQKFWDATLDGGPGRAGYQRAKTVFFTDSVSTGCGGASSQVGPFYCPSDRTIYIDLGFYDQLRERFGASGGPFAEAYVIAHEYGHHVQNLIGVLERSRSGGTGPDSPAVKVELMADCLAGMWAAGAVGDGFIEELTEQDIRDGLDAAAAVGDDRIQESIQGRVDPESWTHGSARQRQDAFMSGYRAQNIRDCDPFN